MKSLRKLLLNSCIFIFICNFSQQFARNPATTQINHWGHLMLLFSMTRATIESYFYDTYINFLFLLTVEAVSWTSFSLSEHSEAFGDQNSAWLTHHTSKENMRARTSEPIINAHTLCFVTQWLRCPQEAAGLRELSQTKTWFSGSSTFMRMK